MRLQRIMADAGIASRRECERLIETGHVSVNGRLVRTMPVLVDPHEDDIRVDGRPLPRPTRRARPRLMYIMLNKPASVLSATRDDPAFADSKGRGRTTVLDLVSIPGVPRLFPVGRLDFHSTGFVLLTNDGALAERLTHARYGVPKSYEVLVKRRVEESELHVLTRSISGASRAAPGRAAAATGTRPASPRQVTVDLVKYDADRSMLRITMPEGTNRSVVEVLDRLGFHVKKLRRVAIGPVELSGVALGQWRPLTPREVRMLKAAGGLGRSSATRTGSKPVAPAGSSSRSRPRRRPEPSESST